MQSSGINQDPVDRFTSAHAGVGILLAAIRAPWWAALGTTVGWELLENRLKDRNPDLFPYSSHDSIANSVTDSVAVMGAYAVTRHLLDAGMTPAGHAAYRSALGSTLGAFVGSVGFGLVGRLLPGEGHSIERLGQATQQWGRIGYQIGCAVGASLAGATTREHQLRDAASLGGLVGGAAFGPLGAAAGTYVAVDLRARRQPVLGSAIDAPAPAR